MHIEFSKITSKGQITIPLSVRKELGVSEGDRIEFKKHKDSVVVSKAKSIDIDYYRNVQKSFSEWNSDADNEAYNDL